MAGHVQRTTATRNFPNGGWEARWRDPDTRKWRGKTFARKVEAQRFLSRVDADMQRGIYSDPQLARTLFRQVAADWLATNPGQKIKTRIGYESLLNNHVLPFFGDMAVGKLSKTTVRQWIAELEAKGAGPGTVRNAFRNVLKPVLDVAVEQGCMPANPAVGVKLARSVRQEMLFLTADEVAALAQAIGPPYDLLVTFAAYTGLRAGELGALRVKHVEMLRGRVTVAESVAEVVGHGLIYGPTKTYAVRTVTLPTFLRDPLTLHLAARAKDPDAFVFTAMHGGPLRQGNFYRRYFKPAVFTALPSHLHRLRFHDLRHTCAALLINPPVSANPKVVQTRLGHSSIQVTFDRYGHLFPGWDEQLNERLEAVHREARPAATASVTVLR